MPKSVDVTYHDPKLDLPFDALKAFNRDSLGFAPLDSTSRIIYKEEFEGTLVKVFFERPGYLTILYFEKDSSGLRYRREEEIIKGPRKMFVKDVDGYKTEIQETITRIYDADPNNLAGKHFRLTFLDFDAYHADSFEYHPDRELSIEEAKEIIAQWRSYR